MKKLLLAIMLLCSVTAFAQITTTKIISKSENVKEIIPYDSTYNFPGKNVKGIIGQELYLLPMPDDFQKYGYDDFYTRIDGSEYRNVYKPEKRNKHNSSYYELQGQYFKVIDIIDHPKKNQNKFLYGDKSYLKLKNKESGDQVFFKYDAKYEKSFPFVVMGFFNKEKNLCQGKQYVSRGRNWKETVNNMGKPMHDIKTGEDVILTPGSIWTVQELTIEEEDCHLVYIVVNDKNETITLDIEDIDNTRCVYTIAKMEEFKIKYPDFWKIIIAGKVEIGMSKAEVRLSWGAPKKINRSSSGDQWVYDGQYLYFKGDKMTSFN